MHIHVKGCVVAVAALSMVLLTQAGRADDQQPGETAPAPDPSSIPQVPTSPTVIEKARQAVDLLLADTLDDPMSAIQYRISLPIPCARLSTAQQEKALLCICYGVNTRNKNGGYEGTRLDYASLKSEKGGTFVASKSSALVNTYVYSQHCDAADFQKRKSKRIHDLVD